MTSSLFSIITVMLLTGATVISVCATGSPSIVNAVTVDYFPCSDPAALDASLSTLLHQQPGRSQTECVSACYRHSSCTSVAHVQNDDVTSTCFLLGGISQTPAVFTQPAKCTMLILNPCPAGIAVSRGQCQCPEGLTGQFCEIQNPAECLNTWKKAYSSDGTGDLNAVINSNQITAGGYLKAGLHGSDGSLIVLNGKYFFSNVGSIFASQVARSLSRKSWDQFDDVPATEFRFVSSGGYMQQITDMDGSVNSSQLPLVDWFVRLPHVTNMVYKYSITGNALSGKTLADLDSAVRNGQVIVTYNAVHVNRSQSGAANLVHLSRYHYEISRRPGTYNFQSDSYWLTQKHSTDGKAKTHRFKIADNIFKDATLSTNRAGELHLDSCWRAAAGSSHNDNNNDGNNNNNNNNNNDNDNDNDNNSNNNNNTGQLISAILNGNAARVIVDDVALTLDQVSVAGDVVVFGALQYLDPVGSGAYTQDSMVVHVVATSQGQVFTCKTLPQDGTPFYNTTSAGTVTWFVDTRQRSRVYSVTSQGEVLLGQESELYAAAANGATVHVGIVFSEPNHYLLMPVSILKLTSDDHVVAQVEGLSRLPIMEGRVTPWLDCGLRALLVTSQGAVRLYEYRHREPGTHTNLTALTIHWFVDFHADN